MTIGRGQLTGIGHVAFARRGHGVPGRRSRPPTGPTWFRKMDRNRDGDVSRREFLGPRGEFDRLDRDHDGLIDPAEAAHAVAKSKKTAAR